jgi:hypothetical protein
MPPAPVRVPSQKPTAGMLLQPGLSVNNKSDNEKIPGAVHRSPSIHLIAGENTRKHQLGHHR